MDTEDESENYTIYRDALAAVLIDRLAEPLAKPQKKRRKAQATATLEDATTTDNASPDDAAEFVDYLARESFDLLPPELQTLTHHTWVADARLRAKLGGGDGEGDDNTPAPPLTPSDVTALLPGLDPSPVADSLAAYGLTGEAAGEKDGGGRSAADIVAPALSAYLQAVTTPPPPPPPPPLRRDAAAAAEGCEICGRAHVPLTYHHLIPRMVHAKAVKRGWHRRDALQNVAWLCSACHRRVHQFASHEDLARHYYTVDRLLAEPAMQRYAAWASRLRWGGSRT